MSKDIKFIVGENNAVLAVHEIQLSEYTSHISSASRKKAIIDLSQFLPPKFFIAEIERSCHKLSYDIFTILKFDVILKLFDNERGHKHRATI